jgi:ATP-dependent DNA ligase
MRFAIDAPDPRATNPDPVLLEEVERARHCFDALVLSRVYWVRPALVVEVKCLTWTYDNLLRQVVYEGLREDEPAAEVRRAVPYPKT